MEVLEDVTFRVPPFDRRGAAHDPGGPRVPAVPWRPKRREGGHRSLVDVVMKLQRLAVDQADRVAEVDINPLLAC